MEPSGATGIALACGENRDACMLDSDLHAHAFGGRMWYYNSEQTGRMPAVPPVVAADAAQLEQLQQSQNCRWLCARVFVIPPSSLIKRGSVEFYYCGPSPPASLPPRLHIYPAPRYLKLCYLAHRIAGQRVLDSSIPHIPRGLSYSVHHSLQAF